MSRTAINKTLIKKKIELLEKKSQYIQNELNDELAVSKSRIADLAKITFGVTAGVVISVIILKGILGKESASDNSYRRKKSTRVYQRFFDQLFSEFSGQAFELVVKTVKKKLNSHNKNSENARS